MSEGSNHSQVHNRRVRLIHQVGESIFHIPNFRLENFDPSRHLTRSEPHHELARD